MTGSPLAETAAFLRSVGARLGFLVVAFVAVPVILYGQFESAEHGKRTALLRSLQAEGHLISQALRMGLEASPGATVADTRALMQRIDPRGMKMRLLFRPAATPAAELYLIAAAPAVSADQLERERRELAETGVIQTIPTSCQGAQPLDLRYYGGRGGEEVLTSITPFTTKSGCWAIITSHSTSEGIGALLGGPYWQSSEIQLAAGTYAVLALLVLALFGGLWRNLHRFAVQARLVAAGSTGAAPFGTLNRVPELTQVAEEFDRMVLSLRASAEAMRHAAEDNAHAFKIPIATVAQAIEPLRRAVPAEDPRGRRALQLIESSVARLDALVTASRRMDETNASLVNPPRERVDLSRLVGSLAASYAEIAAEKKVALAAAIAPGCVVLAGPELLETVVENILDNALSFSPAGGTVRMSLTRGPGGPKLLRLVVEDEGPGAAPEMLAHMFERYVSHRPGAAAPAEQHFGVGLWIVRRNVAAIGGTVNAENRGAGGLRMTVTLPAA